MEIPALVISNPPHGEVDLEAAAHLLGLDVFMTRLKARFAAPEIMSASEPEQAEELADALRGAGFTVSALHGSALSGLPWPDPVSSLAFDVSCLRATIRNEGIELAYDVEAVGVHCAPPAGFTMKPTVDLRQAVVSGHGPTIAEAIQWTGQVDLYFRDHGSLRRVSIVPDLLELDGEEVVRELGRRFKCLRLDTRLAGVRPRARFVAGKVGFDPSERKRYSFGTLRLRQVLRSISPELGDAPHYELGSRIAYALSPLRPAAERFDAGRPG